MFNGRIHISYQSFSTREQFNQLVEDARTFAFKHTVKATAIDEAMISYPEKKVYGIYYSIDGNTASSVQFFLTDSTKNYLRGALYFNEQPRLDSIQPVLDFIKKDVDQMIKTFKWKNQ
jgi:gliding motility-associated lipoprotein GldD